jgi:1-deoxy-D-xylulose-5-phosphate reductoisomerase
MDWTEAGRLDFEPVDRQRFPALDLAYRAIEAGGTAGAIFNAANEAAVAAFMDRRIPFGRIPQLVEAAMDAIPATAVTELDQIHQADLAARDTVETLLANDRTTMTAPAEVARSD